MFITNKSNLHSGIIQIQFFCNSNSALGIENTQRNIYLKKFNLSTWIANTQKNSNF